jgi:LuxR family maltose regulon positive regulatory protein
MIHQGELLMEQDSLELAESDIRRGLDYCSRAGDVTGELAGYLALAHLRRLRGDGDGARAAIEKADQIAGRETGSHVRAMIGASRAWVDLAGDNLPDAERWARSIQEQRPKRREFPRSVQEFEDLVLARIRLAQGRAADAECILEQVLYAAESAGRGGAVIQALALQALARSAVGDTGPALESLCRAVALGGPQGYARTFANEGEPMRSLLEALSAQEQATAGQNGGDRPGCRAPLVRSLLDRFGSDVAGRPPEEDWSRTSSPPPVS